MSFGKVITAMITPFTAQLELDYGKVKWLVEHLIEVQKTDGIVVCGTTGESPTLTKDEKIALFSKVLEVANGRCKVIAGTGGNDTASSIALSQAAEQAGVDGLLLVNPYYNKPSQDGLFQHFKAIAESTKLPIMLYNIPGRTAVNMSADTTIRLSKIENIVAMKEASGDLTQMAQIISGASDDFMVYCGDDKLLLPTLAIGGYGVVSVASHLVGPQLQEMISLYRNGNVIEAAKLHRELLPLFEGLFITSNPVPLKALLKMKGYDMGGVRLPLVEASEQEIDFLKTLI